MIPPASVAPANLGESQLQFQLQFTRVQYRPRRYMHDGDLRWCTPVDVRVRRAADS
jgi:hypothetical protein